MLERFINKFNGKDQTEQEPQTAQELHSEDIRPEDNLTDREYGKTEEEPIRGESLEENNEPISNIENRDERIAGDGGLEESTDEVSEPLETIVHDETIEGNPETIVETENNDVSESLESDSETVSTEPEIVEPLSVESLSEEPQRASEEGLVISEGSEVPEEGLNSEDEVVEQDIIAEEPHGDHSETVAEGFEEFPEERIEGEEVRPEETENVEVEREVVAPASEETQVEFVGEPNVTEISEPEDSEHLVDPGQESEELDLEYSEHEESLEDNVPLVGSDHVEDSAMDESLEPAVVVDEPVVTEEELDEPLSPEEVPAVPLVDTEDPEEGVDEQYDWVQKVGEVRFAGAIYAIDPKFLGEDENSSRVELLEDAGEDSWEIWAVLDPEERYVTDYRLSAKGVGPLEEELISATLDDDPRYEMSYEDRLLVNTDRVLVYGAQTDTLGLEVFDEEYVGEDFVLLPVSNRWDDPTLPITVLKNTESDKVLGIMFVAETSEETPEEAEYNLLDIDKQ